MEQVFGLFFLPRGRPRPRRTSGSPWGSDLGTMTASGGDSGSGSIGKGTATGASGSCVAGTEVGGAEGPYSVIGTEGTSSLGEGDGKVIGSSCSLSKTCGANSDAGSLPNNS